MIRLKDIALVLLGAAIGFIIVWVAGIGISINLFWGVLLTATGAIIGFVIEWVIDEAYRRNPDLRRRLLGQESRPPAPVEPGVAASEDAGSAELVAAELVAAPEDAGSADLVAAELVAAPEDAGSADLESLSLAQEAMQRDPTVAAETLAHFLRRRDEEIQTLRAELDQGDDQLAELRAEFEAYQRAHPDDLTVIKGIGPVYQRKLRDLGVGSYKQLAAAEPERLRRMLDIKNWQRVDIESWVAQARDWAQRG